MDVVMMTNMKNQLGGIYYKDKIVNIVRENIGNKKKALEVCCGCGIIGKTLLESSLVETMTFSDIQDLSKEYDDFIQSDALDNVSEKYDLVVCSPPWYNSEEAPSEYLSKQPSILWRDLDWQFHKKFYKKIIDILAEDGSLLMTSCFGARQPEEWVDMCNLKIKKVFINQSPIGDTYPSNYILWWTH
jgi:methylase of polypeptide subunit release factors